MSLRPPTGALWVLNGVIGNETTFHPVLAPKTVPCGVVEGLGTNDASSVRGKVYTGRLPEDDIAKYESRARNCMHGSANMVRKVIRRERNGRRSPEE